MDSLYLTGLPDSLSLQEMLDCDIKTEMDVDDCFSLGELPPLALEDSLDAKWELIDPSSSNGLLFSRATPLHSPGSDMTMWFNAGGSGVSGMVGNSSLDIDPTAMMVNPSSVMPLTLVSTPAPAVSRPTPAAAVNTPVASVVTSHIVTHTVQTQSLPRPKISRPSSINIVCSQNSPFTIVRTTSIASATTSTLAKADSNCSMLKQNSVRSPAVVRSKPQLVQQASLNDVEGKAYPKPAYSYSCLIALALKNSSSGSLPVSEIYNFMCEHFPYFKTAPNGWKNSVRHNLSLNKCFEKIEKPTGNGSQRKGCLWAMNPAKTTKMDDEVQKWSRKDPIAIRRAMVIPDNLEMLERGEMKRELPSSSTHSGDDSESEGTSEEEVPTTPPVSPPQEQPFTPPHIAARRGLGDCDPIGHDDTEEEDEDFVDIGALDQLGDQSLSEFDLDVNEGLYEELGEERLNLGVNISAGSKIQANYICKQQSYVCKPSSTSTTVRIRKVQPAILLTNNKRQHI